MPLVYTSYGCKFKCGHKHSENKAKIEEHEKICWYNPKNKTCCTCKHGEYVNYNEIHDELPERPAEHINYRICDNPIIGYDAVFTENNDNVLPNEHCEYWEGK